MTGCLKYRPVASYAVQHHRNPHPVLITIQAFAGDRSRWRPHQGKREIERRKASIAGILPCVAGEAGPLAPNLPERPGSHSSEAA